MKKIIISLTSIVFMLLMILSPKTSLFGASRGLLLWFNNVLPTLLPFMIATNVIIRLNVMGSISSFFNRRLKTAVSFPVCIVYIILTGLLCGFPMGAKVINDFYKNGDITFNEASWLVSFCNLPSPVFIISYTAVNTLSCSSPSIIIISFYFSAAVISILSYIFNFKINKPKNINIKNKSDAMKEHRFSISSFESSLTDSYIAIAKIGGYMIIFSVMAAFLEQAYIINALSRCIFVCLLEITTGISIIPSLNIPQMYKIMLALATLSIGGMSCAAQTKGVLSDTPVKFKIYMLWRMLHAVFSMIICYIMFNY